jgi:hypothetical protein
VTQLLDLPAQFVDRAFQLRPGAWGLAYDFGPGSHLRAADDRTLAAHQSLAFPFQGHGLIVQAGCPEVVDGHAQMMEATFHLFTFARSGWMNDVRPFEPMKLDLNPF